jgi:tetratricopeptide (TPR) repeat protein
MLRLSRLLRSAGRYAEAEPFARDVLEIVQKISGREDRMLARAQENIAQVRLRMGRFDEALMLGQAALDAHDHALGRGHSWTKDSARVTADALDALGRTEEAKALRERYGVVEPENPKSS